jgi:hypothetical protein
MKCQDYLDCGNVGICIYCDGCFINCCTCDPCQHGKRRDEECVFCERKAKVND